MAPIANRVNAPTGDGREWDLVGGYGAIRAGLNPMDGKDDDDYFARQSNELHARVLVTRDVRIKCGTTCHRHQCQQP